MRGFFRKFSESLKIKKAKPKTQAVHDFPRCCFICQSFSRDVPALSPGALARPGALRLRRATLGCALHPLPTLLLSWGYFSSFLPNEFVCLLPFEP